MSSIDQLFTKLRGAGQKALMPFITAGDPDLDFTAEVLAAMVAHGANLCELGIPYSDPIADGPVIQASYTRALAKHIKLADILATLRKTTGKVAAPIVTMVSYAIVHRHGLARYVADAQAAGVAGAIVPDLLVDESEELATICRKADFSLIQLVAPTTPRDRVLKIAERSTGFLYYVSLTGVTGERRELPDSLLNDLAWLRERTPLPVCVGFGVSQPEHVRVLAPVVDGVIVGSAVVRRVAEAADRPRAEVLREVGQFIATLAAALKG